MANVEHGLDEVLTIENRLDCLRPLLRLMVTEESGANCPKTEAPLVMRKDWCIVQRATNSEQLTFVGGNQNNGESQPEESASMDSLKIM